jgi:hypothetical protein
MSKGAERLAMTKRRRLKTDTGHFKILNEGGTLYV